MTLIKHCVDWQKKHLKYNLTGTPLVEWTAWFLQNSTRIRLFDPISKKTLTSEAQAARAGRLNDWKTTNDKFKLEVRIKMCLKLGNIKSHLISRSMI